MSMDEQEKKLLDEVAIIGDGRKQSKYYDNAEATIGVFWGENSLFFRLFKQLDLTRVVELVCGHGRHAQQIKGKVGDLVLMDYDQENIDFCRNRFSGQTNITYLRNNGLDFSPVEDASVTSIFCYDAMVHFDHRTVLRYLQDTRRVLIDGGKALYHHSNNSYPFAAHYGQNPHSRNFMTKELFARYCLDSGLQVLEQETLAWGGGDNRIENLDCVTVVQK